MLRWDGAAEILNTVGEKYPQLLPDSGRIAHGASMPDPDSCSAAKSTSHSNRRDLTPPARIGLSAATAISFPASGGTGARQGFRDLARTRKETFDDWAQRPVLQSQNPSGQCLGWKVNRQHRQRGTFVMEPHNRARKGCDVGAFGQEPCSKRNRMGHETWLGGLEPPRSKEPRDKSMVPSPGWR